MSKEVYNVVINNQVYLIYQDEGVGGCKYLGSVHKRFRFYNPLIKAKALKACQHI